MKTLLLSFSFVFLFSISSLAQSLPGKEIRNREIEWSDFSGQIKQNSQWDAETYWTTLYSFPAPTFQGNSAYVNITVRLFLRADSWTKPNKQTARLLEHERGHFNIGRICANEIEETINSTPFDRNNYKQQVEAAYWQIIKKYQDLNAQYENETDHYRNVAQQKKWDKKLAELLDEN